MCGSFKQPYLSMKFTSIKQPFSLGGGYLAYEKTHPARTLQKPYTKGPRGVLGGWVFPYERGTPVTSSGRVFIMNAISFKDLEPFLHELGEQS